MPTKQFSNKICESIEMLNFTIIAWILLSVFFEVFPKFILDKPFLWTFKLQIHIWVLWVSYQAKFHYFEFIKTGKKSFSNMDLNVKIMKIQFLMVKSYFWLVHIFSVIEIEILINYAIFAFSGKLILIFLLNYLISPLIIFYKSMFHHFKFRRKLSSDNKSNN